jgi:hypothetical protein
VHFGGRTVAIRCACDKGREIAEFLFHDLERHDDCAAPHVELTIESGSTAGSLRLLKPGEETYEADSPGGLATRLVGDTIFHLTDKCDHGMVFHAAAVSLAGRAMILPAKSGSGKTTLTAWLLRQGFNYLTDELVFIATGSTDVHAFTRPLNVKRRALPVIRGELDIELDDVEALDSRIGSLIPHRLFNPHHSNGRPPLAVVLFPCYRKKAELELTALSSAQTGLRLMQCLVNARNLAGHGFQDVSRLARQVRGYTLTYSRFDQIGTRLKALLDANP